MSPCNFSPLAPLRLVGVSAHVTPVRPGDAEIQGDAGDPLLKDRSNAKRATSSWTPLSRWRKISAEVRALVESSWTQEFKSKNRKFESACSLRRDQSLPVQKAPETWSKAPIAAPVRLRILDVDIAVNDAGVTCTGSRRLAPTGVLNVRYCVAYCPCRSRLG